MGILDRFKGKAGRGYSPVGIEFTEAELESINRAIDRFASILSADAPAGMTPVVPRKCQDAVIARGLADYAEDLLLTLEGCDSEGDIAKLLERATKAQVKAYAVHNLPVYLYQAAGLFELSGDLRAARDLFGLFLEMQGKFSPDEIDEMFLSLVGLDSSHITLAAREKLK
jgi:hypothetical protein